MRTEATAPVLDSHADQHRDNTSEATGDSISVPTLEYATAMLRRYPYLAAASCGVLDDAGNYHEAHHYVTDGTHAYDAAGRHPMPYLGPSEEKYNHYELGVPITDYDAPDETLVAAADEQIRQAWELLPTADAKPSAVWVLVIYHRHGSNITVHSTEDSAWRDVASFARQWWEETRGYVNEQETPAPADNDEAIMGYFCNNLDDDSYTLERQELSGL